MPFVAFALAPMLLAASAHPAEEPVAPDYYDSDVEPSKVPRRVRQLDRSLRKSGLPGRVLSCTDMVDVAVGTALGNHSYGGICKVAFGSKRTDLLLCNDEMVGHFAISASYAVTRERVVRFVTNNCTGG